MACVCVDIDTFVAVTSTAWSQGWWSAFGHLFACDYVTDSSLVQSPHGWWSALDHLFPFGYGPAAPGCWQDPACDTTSAADEVISWLGGVPDEEPASRRRSKRDLTIRAEVRARRAFIAAKLSGTAASDSTVRPPGSMECRVESVPLCLSPDGVGTDASKGVLGEADLAAAPCPFVGDSAGG